MPGPVSDSYDPEFGTGQNAHELRVMIHEVRIAVTLRALGGDPTLKNIIEVINGDPGPEASVSFTEREWRIIRFALWRAAQTI